MGFLIIYMIPYLLFNALVIWAAVYVWRRERQRVGSMFVLLLLLLPYWDLLIGKGLMFYHGLWWSPLQKIVKTVEFPVSVLWVDDVWPGYDEYGRDWMVKNYLDGSHLQTLALNGDDGMIYVYRATEKDFAGSSALYPELAEWEKKEAVVQAEATKIFQQFRAVNSHLGFPEFDNKAMEFKSEHPLWREKQKVKKKTGELRSVFWNQKKLELQQIMAGAQRYSADDFKKAQQTGIGLPSFRYTVNFQPIRLSGWQGSFIWCDEINIRDNEQAEDIAFSKRCLGYNSRIWPNFVGGDFYGGVRMGDERAYEFDDKVLFGYAGLKNNFELIRNKFRRNKYNRARLAWKRKFNKQEK